MVERHRESAIPFVAAVVVVLFVASIAQASAAVGPRVRLTSRGNELARTTGLRRNDFPAALRGGFVQGRPGIRACGGSPPPDDGLSVGGYATASFSSSTALVSSKVTIYRDSPSTDKMFERLHSTFTTSCTAAAAGVTEHISSVKDLHPRLPLDHARGLSLVLTRGGIPWTARVYILGEGRIASILIVEQRGRRPSGNTAQLALSLLVSRMED